MSPDSTSALPFWSDALSFWSDAISRTFLVEERYKIFLQGFWNTMLITVGALLLGVFIGVSVAIVRVYVYQAQPQPFWKSAGQFLRTGKPFWLRSLLLKSMDALAELYLTLFRGTPVVVQLMIWSFVILTTTNPILVAIIGFGVNSGAYVAEIARAGIMAVDKGQTEAGRSLGLSAWTTMRLIVLPQALKNVLPALGNEFISLLKETSIVGYIAIVDLTKAAGLVRARTFDAFFPLICVALVYLALVLLLSAVQKGLERRMRESDRK